MKNENKTAIRRQPKEKLNKNPTKRPRRTKTSDETTPKLTLQL